jgi:DNA topoisomerase-1
MIVDREKEIEAFVPEPYWVLSVHSDKDGEHFEAQHTEGKFTDKTQATAAYEKTSAPLTVQNVKEGSRNDRAPGPFDTTSFIVAAARLGISASQAMRTAEALYMNGLISYPRTDNTVYPASLDLDALLKELSGTVFKRDVTWVEAHRRKEPTRGKKSTTDHPPIHPTGAAKKEMLDDTQWKVYELVVRRFLATLSPDARWKTIKYSFDAGGEPYAATGSRLDEEGYRHVYTYSGAKDTILPELTTGEKLPVEKKNLEEKETLPPPRYSQSKLIQEMERLSLGTKSTRHDVIGKLFSRRYVEGNPLKPTAVGRAVTETLEGHSIAITRPEMTKTLEEHMEKIKEGVRAKETVISESQEMLREVFDVLEENETAISEEIVTRTDAERVVGPCPICGSDLSIRSTKKGVQFIGCKSYPECNFHINLPPSQWGNAMREGTVCPTHHLHHVRLIRRGAPPWDIGCPLCSHINSNIEGLMLMPSVDQNLVDRMHEKFIYTVYDIQQMAPEELKEALGVSIPQANTLIAEASEVLELYRRRAGLKRFVRSIIQPKRGRGYAKVTNAMNEGGIDDVDTLAEKTPEVLMTMHLTTEEANELLATAQAQKNKARLKELGVPAVSLKKYMEAGFTTPEVFCVFPPVYLSYVSGLSITTVQKHVASVCSGLGKPVPDKVAKKDIDKGKTELLEVSGLGEAALISLYRAGIYNKKTLADCNLADAAAKSGLSEEKLASFKEALQ